ncbi:aromatic-L-amino acid amidohydrolase [Seminavis robusta]|uniref:Aromatic-L-amino acid amidohydrolase n=1 Tax=Seminavis robusta TaxID=568900 RepID=A0A9N8DSQ8_9STRA|nr:aromatic-L-amino acid amidohydrolase [Seminavis robusta]|eukprot:Sro315_g115320.1 aromatic-L-amino acid amidohydrolase (400) ;mRNA; f:46460-47659
MVYGKLLPLLVFALPLPSHALASAAGNISPVRSVVVVGGTHGNEYTGVWCIKELEQPSVFKSFSKQYPSLDISTLIGNPDAHLANRRFLDTDLNREFTTQKLQAIQDKLDALQGDPEQGIPIESLRANQINKLLGPKTDPTTDVVVDLHTTTTNMGVAIIIPENDPLMLQAAAYVLHKCRENPVKSLPNSGPTVVSEEAYILLESIPDRDDRPFLASVAKHEFTIEIGPVPQGVVRHDGVEKTKQAMEAFLEFLEKRNKDCASDSPDEGVRKQIKQWFPSGRVPCYQSAKTTRPGENLGKIQWPCADDNPNFPSHMVHKSIQDQDFKLLRRGDPLFVTMTGDVIPYDGSHGDSVYLMFINEGGYYYSSSGTGIGVAVKTEYDLETSKVYDADEISLNGS